jgi:hypothetical protein
MLFNVFLDMSQRAVMTRPTIAFAADICVRVPEYTVDGFLFLRDHFEGGYLFRDLVTLEATPPATAKDAWKIEYRFAGQGSEPKQAKATKTADGLSFEIPIEQPKPPGIKARLRVETRFWNRWHAETQAPEA